MTFWIVSSSWSDHLTEQSSLTVTCALGYLCNTLDIVTVELLKQVVIFSKSTNQAVPIWWVHPWHFVGRLKEGERERLIISRYSEVWTFDKNFFVLYNLSIGQQAVAYLGWISILPFCCVILVSLSDVHIPALVVKETIAGAIVVSVDGVDPEAEVVALIRGHSRTDEYDTASKGIITSIKEPLAVNVLPLARSIESTLPCP